MDLMQCVDGVSGLSYQYLGFNLDWRWQHHHRVEGWSHVPFEHHPGATQDGPMPKSCNDWRHRGTFLGDLLCSGHDFAKLDICWIVLMYLGDLGWVKVGFSWTPCKIHNLYLFWIQ